MVPYIILFVCLLFFCFFEVCRFTNTDGQENTKNKYKNAYAIIPFLIIFFLGVFREISVGKDSGSYVTFYWNLLDMYSWNELFTNFSIDNGFYIILKVLALFTDDWWLVRSILFGLTFSLYYAIMAKESNYPCVSLLIFVGLGNIGLMFGVLRQSLAGGICFFAYKYLKKNEWLKFVVLVLIASLIHRSSLISFFVFMVSYFKPKKFTYYKLFVLSGIVTVLFYFVIPIITSRYNNQIYENTDMQDGGYGMLLFLIALFAILGYLINYIKRNEEITEQKHKLEDEDKMVCLYNISCGALFVQIGALQWGLLTRITVYFSIYCCLLFPELLSKVTQKNRIQLYLVLVVLFGFMFFYQLGEDEVFIMHSF